MFPVSVSERFSNLPTSHSLSVAEPGLKSRHPGFTVCALHHCTLAVLGWVAKVTVSLPSLRVAMATSGSGESP